MIPPRLVKMSQRHEQGSRPARGMEPGSGILRGVYRGQNGRRVEAELAERMETTQSVVARLESGRVQPSTRTLEKIARATGTRLRISFDPA